MKISAALSTAPTVDDPTMRIAAAVSSSHMLAQDGGTVDDSAMRVQEADVKITAAMSRKWEAVDDQAMRVQPEEEDVTKISAAVSTDPWYDAPMAVYPYLLATFAYADMAADKLPRRVAGASMVWIDSGAFSVWTRGDVIDLGAYIEHLHKLHDSIAAPLVPINLDVIPGDPKRRATPQETAAAMRAGERNAETIRAAGLPVMEVWHRGEPLEHLGELLARRRPGEAVGIGGLVGLRPAQVRVVCDPVFAYVLERYPRDALPPLHGLGVGNRDMLWRYPWWACDSSSWIAPGVWGRKMVRGGGTKRDPRTRNRAMRAKECANVLRTWLRWMVELDALWTARGVVHADPPGA